MGNQFASGKHALGICDRCGRTYKLHELKDEYANLHRTGLKTCRSCWDPDHPQLQLGRFRVYDPQALRDARIDTGETASTGTNNWMPVASFPLPVSVGDVTVVRFGAFGFGWGEASWSEDVWGGSLIEL